MEPAVEVQARDKRRLWEMTDAEVVTVANLAIGNKKAVWMVEWVEGIGWGALCINSRRRMMVFLTHKYDTRVSVYAGRGTWFTDHARGQKDIFKYLIDIGVLKF